MVAWISLCPLVKDGDLIPLVQYMIRTGVVILFESRRSKGMLKMLMFNRVGSGWWINRGMLRLIAAADLGRRHQSGILIDARRRLL